MKETRHRHCCHMIVQFLSSEKNISFNRRSAWMKWNGGGLHSGRAKSIDWFATCNRMINYSLITTKIRSSIWRQIDYAVNYCSRVKCLCTIFLAYSPHFPSFVCVRNKWPTLNSIQKHINDLRRIRAQKHSQQSSMMDSSRAKCIGLKCMGNGWKSVYYVRNLHIEWFDKINPNKTK